jgi:hypothetical protein
MFSKQICRPFMHVGKIVHASLHCAVQSKLLSALQLDSVFCFDAVLHIIIIMLPIKP